jgi:RHS repeat-associated protein
MDRREKNMKRFITSLWVLFAVTSQIAFAGESVTYYHGDTLGSPIVATDDRGYLIWEADYLPYGAHVQSTLDTVNSQGNARWYGGHVEDVETGLTYMRARFYDPQVGRFHGIDGARFDERDLRTFNRYAYANDNPFRYIDPDGRDSVFWQTLDKIFNPFSSSMPGDFEAGTRQLMYGNPYPRLDPTEEIIAHYHAENFKTVAEATAKVGDIWINGTYLMLGAEETGVARGALALRGAETANEVGTVFRLTETMANHLGDIVKRGPFKGELARPFLKNFQLLVREIMAAGKGVPDPGGVAGALRYDVPGTFRGVEGTWELVVKDDVILHLNFVVH